GNSSMAQTPPMSAKYSNTQPKRHIRGRKGKSAESNTNVTVSAGTSRTSGAVPTGETSKRSRSAASGKRFRRSRLEVDVTDGIDFTELTPKLWAALSKANKPERLFLQGSMPVRLNHTAPTPQAASAPTL